MNAVQMTIYDLIEDNQKLIGKKRDMLRPISGVNCWYCLYRTDTFCSKFKNSLEINKQQHTYFRSERCYIETSNKVC
jgi:hypothetical protein